MANRALVSAAVVAGEEDDRVVAHSFLLERASDDAADLVVERRDHPRVDPPFLVGNARYRSLYFLGT